MDVGATLREARERRGYSVEELSRITKIGVTMLRALEANDRERLPGGIYTRGFLRACAREVGLDADWLVREYRAQFEPPPVATTSEAGEHTAESTNVVAARREAAPRPIDFTRAFAFTTWLRPALPAIGLALMTALFGYLVAGGPRTPESITAAQAPSVAGGDATGRTASPAEVGTSGREHITTTDAPTAETIRLEIQTVGLCWVEVTIDGARTIYRLMQPGESQIVAAHDDVVLRVGDPAAFAFRVNDTPGRSLGNAGQPATVHITRQNHREFTASW